MIVALSIFCFAAGLWIGYMLNNLGWHAYLDRVGIARAAAARASEDPHHGT